MKKAVLTVLSIGLLGIAAGCGSAQTNTHVTGGQNSVESVLQAAAEAQAETETSAPEVTAEATEVTEITQITENTEETSLASVTEAAAEVTTAAAKQNETQPETIPESSDIIDLSEMDANMVYSEVFAMMTEPEQFMGKTIKMTGICNRYTDINTGADYYACIVKDATACCAQGIEFRLPEGEAYPEYGSEMTVTGTFGSYFEGNNEYYLLTDAKVDNYSSSPNFLQ